MLAKETKRMVDVANSPQIVALLSANQWSINHADLVVENTGNATAFDIIVAFDPPLTVDADLQDANLIPLQNISTLKPGQSLRSYLSEFGDHIDKEYEISISWSLTPAGEERDTLSYIQNISEFRSLTTLGESDPMVQIANQLKKLREDWRAISNGNRKLKTDVYTSRDRVTEQNARRALIKKQAKSQDSGKS